MLHTLDRYTEAQIAVLISLNKQPAACVMATHRQRVFYKKDNLK